MKGRVRLGMSGRRINWGGEDEKDVVMGPGKWNSKANERAAIN